MYPRILQNVKMSCEDLTMEQTKHSSNEWCTAAPLCINSLTFYKHMLYQKTSPRSVTADLLTGYLKTACANTSSRDPTAAAAALSV